MLLGQKILSGFAAEALFKALNSGEFHVFPDAMAQQIGGAYRSFADNVVEANLSEG